MGSKRSYPIRRALAVAAACVLTLSPLSVPPPAAAAPISGVPASDLRTTLNLLGEEHVYLAGAAIAAALGGRDAEFKVAAGATDQNTQELGKAIGSVYGPAAEQKLLALWRAHIGFFVDYTQGAATKDEAKKQKARADLDGYRRDIDDFLTGANPNLPKGAVAQLFAAHVEHLTMAIDKLAAGDTAGGYAMLHTAAHQTGEIMDPLADAIVAQFPDKFPTGAAAAQAPRPAASSSAPAAAPAPAQPMPMPGQLPRTGGAVPAGAIPAGGLGFALLVGGMLLGRRR